MRRNEGPRAATFSPELASAFWVVDGFASRGGGAVSFAGEALGAAPKRVGVAVTSDDKLEDCEIQPRLDGR